MIKIRFLSLDGFSLKDKFQHSKQECNGRIYYIEREKSDTETISTRNAILVDIFGTIVSPKTIREFAEQNNGYQIVDGFVFPSLNLVVSISQDQEEFSEILVYSHKLKPLYERDYIASYPSKLDSRERIEIVPYRSIGDFILGESVHSVQNRFGLQVESYPLKSIIRASPFFLSFYNEVLGQINVVLHQDTELQIGDTLFLVKNGISHLLEKEEVIHRVSHYVFPALGIAIHRELDELVAFDKRILEHWRNVHRPISSW